MRRWSSALALLLAACAQPPARQLQITPAPLEVVPAVELQKPPLSTIGEELAPAAPAGPVDQKAPLGTIDEVFDPRAPVALTRPPLSATAVLTVFPTGAGSLSQVLQVSVGFDVLGAGAPNVAAVEFVDPNGAPYHREEAAVTGSPFQAHHLEFVLPVAATAIDTNKLSGAWSARLLVDGQLVATHGFTLTP